MASSSSPPTAMPSPTTFIQDDANTFRDLVQKLTGFTSDTEKLPSKPSLPSLCSDSTAPREPPFKPRERRQQHTMMRKLEVELGHRPPSQVH
ncbi:hypothetical protein V6N13_051758 [Hibiscus sabdariffa]|uniref:VQ domain-containing protein n=1 Tax=Hibiscus sabdariffa TaxID=183260 RepID=A0ABR2T4E7_9ROSI